MVTVCDFLDNTSIRQDAMDAYRREGYLVLTDLFEPAELAGMRAAWGTDCR